MILVDIALWALFSFLAYFVLYRLVIIFRSSKGRLNDIEKRDYQAKFHKKFTVVIYSHNNSQKVKTLIEAFQGQKYDKDKYSLNILLDNCNNENTKLLEIFGGARLWRINTDVKPLGRYKAFAWLLERVRAFENTNAFVFIDGDCKIKKDFLEKANMSLNDAAVVCGETTKRKNHLFNRMLNLRNKMMSRSIRLGRAHSGLGNMIDTDVLVIRQDILEKIEFETLENGYEEYEYPLKLCFFNIPVVYSSDLTVFKNRVETLMSVAANDFRQRRRIIRTFLNNVGILFSKNSLRLKELVLSLIYPSGMGFVLMCGILLYVNDIFSGTSFSQLIGSNNVIALFGIKIFSDIYALISARVSFNDYYQSIILSLLTPVIYVISIFMGFKAKPGNRKIVKKKNKNYISLEKTVAHATITNGKKEFPCTIEIMRGNDNARAVFIFRDKQLGSGKHTRVSYAVEEIIDKLRKHGFSLKICSNCGYFYMTESSSAHSDGEKGYCLYKNFKESSKEKELMPVWGTCDNIIPCQARAYIFQQLGIENPVAR